MGRGRLCYVGLALLAAAAIGLGAAGGQRARPAVGAAQVQLQEGLPPLVAITFDDGPLRRTTTRLLEGLALREVPATFFLLGERIAGNEELVLEMARQGHQIGMHTYDHVVLSELSNRQRDIQVEKTAAALDDILGPGEYWVRPPYGLVDKSVTSWAAGPLILWSVDPEDWKQPQVAAMIDAVVAQVKDGDIILLHDIYDSSVDAALGIIDRLFEQGYCCVTVEQMMRLRGVQPEAGAVYTSIPPQ